MGRTLIINGVDFEPYLTENGLFWKRNDVDSSEAKSMADGTIRRDRVIVRVTLEVTVDHVKKKLGDAEIGKLLRAIEPQWVNVTYFDPRLGREVTREFYSNNVGATLKRVVNGKREWKLDKFPLIARGVPGDGTSNLG